MVHDETARRVWRAVLLSELTARYGLRTSLNPPCGIPLYVSLPPGTSGCRNALRASYAVRPKEPPRATRVVPDVGPVGSV